MCAVLSALGSVGVNNLISHKTFLQISIKYPSFLPHVVFSGLFYKDIKGPMLESVRHQIGIDKTQKQAIRMYQTDKSETKLQTEQTQKAVGSSDLASLWVKLTQREVLCFLSLI